LAAVSLVMADDDRELPGPGLPVVRYRKRYLRSEVPQADRARLTEAIDQLPLAMSGRLSSLDIKGPLQGTRHRNLYRLRVGDYRVIYWRVADELLVLELDRKDDTSYAHLDRLVIHRRGDGLGLTEVPEAPAQPPAAKRIGRAPSRRSVAPERQNPLTVFEAKELAAVGLDAAAIGLIRTLAPSLEIAEALAGLGVPPETVELVADLWYDPARHLETFRRGGTPALSDARIDDGELAERLQSADSADTVAELGTRDFELVLRGSIEEWMFYLHHSQARIVRHVANGPSRVKGGPGTGKTVAALHRARHLVREGLAERVLLTTFVNVLPSVWETLLERFAPDDAERIEARTVDSIVMAIVAPVDGSPRFISDDDRRKLCEGLCAKQPGLREAIGGPGELKAEFDTVLGGRGIGSLDEYLAVERPGRGRRLGAEDRRAAWEAWEHYRTVLANTGQTDWALLRNRALELVREGHGPRFDGIVVDEAQDLTAVQVELLKAIDTSPDHRNLMLVGDGQQAIYPGGFSLRSVGLDVVGRSFLLRTNWRNTQSIADAAEALMGDLPFGDLDARLAPRPVTDLPLPRRRGDLPELHLVGSDEEGDDVLARLLEEALATHAPSEIAVLGRTNRAWRRGELALKRLGVPSVVLKELSKTADMAPAAVRVGTFEGSKGLEFKLVILVGYRRGDWSVRAFWLKDPGDLADWEDTERRKLFVAMTRARDRLALVASPPLTDSLQQARDRFDEWDWTG
jgi:mRNA-degrading endonuclease RelE of RelBE toxin-antitoxin system